MSTPQFKPGDRVRRIVQSNADHEIGDIDIVVGVVTFGQDASRLDFARNKAGAGEYYELVEDGQPPTESELRAAVIAWRAEDFMSRPFRGDEPARSALTILALQMEAQDKPQSVKPLVREWIRDRFNVWLGDDSIEELIDLVKGAES